MTTRTATVHEYADWMATLKERFGESPLGWAFVCPRCGDVATGQDFKDALAQHPIEGKTASDFLGRACIGRVLGALERPSQASWDADRKKGLARGCDWVAYGLLRGPEFVRMESDGTEVAVFRMADAPKETVE